MYQSIQINKHYFQQYRLFIDLDGVLVDFEKGVLDFCGRSVQSFEPRNTMWQSIVRIPEFYLRLSWMPDGKKLWEAVEHLCPSILTGVPRGSWAEPQKRTWCKQELGEEVAVYVCRSSEKAIVASELCAGAFLPILIDDRSSLQQDWESTGGIFIHHRNTPESLEALQGHLQDL